MTYRRLVGVSLLVLFAAELAGCSGAKAPTEEDTMTDKDRRLARRGKLFGDIQFGPGAKKGQEGDTGAGAGIAVNGFLWRASLDTMAFMPLASADPFGGVIITDWYTPPESPNERFKTQIYILDRQLRADGIRVSVFRQVRDATGGWSDATTRPETAAELENAILTRARQLRIESGGAP